MRRRSRGSPLHTALKYEYGARLTWPSVSMLEMNATGRGTTMLMVSAYMAALSSVSGSSVVHSPPYGEG